MHEDWTRKKPAEPQSLRQRGAPVENTCHGCCSSLPRPPRLPTLLKSLTSGQQATSDKLPGDPTCIIPTVPHPTHTTPPSRPSVSGAVGAAQTRPQ